MAREPNDLTRRTFEFARLARRLIDRLPRSVANFEDARQLARSSGSVAANYLEAQEGLSRKDFFYRIKVCRKEARESALWLRLLDISGDGEANKQREKLIDEAEELKRIFARIASKDDTQD